MKTLKGKSKREGKDLTNIPGISVSTPTFPWKFIKIFVQKVPEGS